MVTQENPSLFGVAKAEIWEIWVLKVKKKVFSVKIQLSTRASSAIFCLFENIKFVEEK